MIRILLLALGLFLATAKILISDNILIEGIGIIIVYIIGVYINECVRRKYNG